MEDLIHQSTFQYINSLSAQLSTFRPTDAPVAAQNEVPLQIILHTVSCASALRDMLESTTQVSQQSKAPAVSAQIFQPFLNGILASLGKLVMDCFSFEPKLHDLESFASSYQLVMRHTLRLFPEMATKRHKSSGKMLLHHAVFKCKASVAEETVRAILSVSPESVQSADSSGALPLHWATRNGDASLSVLDLLLDAYPQAASVADSRGFLPLHWAVNQDEPSLEVVRKLLKIYPEAAKLPTSSGAIAAHFCVQRERFSQSVLKTLLNAFPDALRSRDSDGFLPLHRFVHQERMDFNCLRHLLTLAPDCAQQLTNHRQSILHLALDFATVDTQAATLMLETSPLSCATADAEGYLPLHLSLDCASPNYVLCSRILAANPAAAGQSTKDNMLPLHLMIAANEAPQLSFVRELLESFPGAIGVEVRDIVPAIDGEALLDPENWSGEWIETSWKPAERARDRGLLDLAKLLEEFPKMARPAAEIVSAKPAADRVAAAPAIAQSQPLKVIPLATPPKKFVLASGSQPVNLAVSAPAEVEPFSPLLHRPATQPAVGTVSQSDSHGKNNNMDDDRPTNTGRPITQPASGLPQVEDESSPDLFARTLPATLHRVPSASAATLGALSRQLSGDRLVAADPLIDNFVHSNKQSPRVGIMEVRDFDGDGDAQRGIASSAVPAAKERSVPSRAPPPGPIPASLLQAAESNAKRLSKAQYDFLKNGKVNKKAIRSVAKTRQTNAVDSESDTADERPTRPTRLTSDMRSNANISDSEEGRPISARLRVKQSATNASLPQRSRVLVEAPVGGDDAQEMV